MSELLRIVLIQTDIVWENKQENLSRLTEKIFSDLHPADLVILPEMFSTGFSMNTSLAEDMSGPTLQWMKETAAKKNAVICGSMIAREEEIFFNRLIWMFPDGKFSTYNKRHLFSLGDEHQHYAPGHERLIVHLNGWNICPLICYDLRFPVWSRNSGEYDLLIYVANWPERRIDAWKKLLPARAIENQCYVAAVNRTGNDGSGFFYNGYSQIIDPMGRVMWEGGNEKNTPVVSLSMNLLKKIRSDFPFLHDADSFKLLDT